MATVKEWETWMSLLTQGERDELTTALKTLEAYSYFSEQFKDTGIFDLIQSVEYVNRLPAL